jgi:hypothetical protein
MGWLGDYTNPILKTQAAEVLKKVGDLIVIGTVSPDLHNSCWPEPPPFVMALHFGVLIVPLRDEVTFVYLLHNTVRHVRLNATLTPSWQCHSVGRYEGDMLVIDTVGIKDAPLSGDEDARHYDLHRRVVGDWPEAICAENTQWYPGTYSAVPMADKPDF